MQNVTEFATTRLPSQPTEIAPDGSVVRKLLRLAGGTLAHFELRPGQTSRCVVHRSVEEIWFVVSGHGELWRKQAGRETVVRLEPDVCVTVPRGTQFQFRASHKESIAVIAVTMPPWPGGNEVETVTGPWAPSPEGTANVAS